MILNFDLSKEELAALSLEEREEVLYAVPYDCDRSGNFVKNAFTVVTNKRLVLLQNAVKEREYLLAEYEAVKAEPRINCGVLYGVKDGQDYLMVRYSSKHLARYAYVARGIALLKSGSTERAVSEENEKTCFVCGRALPGTKECPHCNGKYKGVLQQLFALLASYKKQMVPVVIFMLLTAGVTLLGPEVQKHLLDDVLYKETSDYPLGRH